MIPAEYAAGAHVKSLPRDPQPPLPSHKQIPAYAVELAARPTGTCALVELARLGYTIICLLAGRLVIGLLGLIIPFLGLVGAIRLGHPSSFWARRFYGERKVSQASVPLRADGGPA